MTQWYSKDFGDGVDAHIPTQEILQAHQAFMLAHRGTSGAVVFSRYDTETNVVTVYFSPAAEVLALQFGASACDKPAPTGGLRLLSGVITDLATHFPNQPIR